MPWPGPQQPAATTNILLALEVGALTNLIGRTDQLWMMMVVVGKWTGWWQLDKPRAGPPDGWSGGWVVSS